MAEVPQNATEYEGVISLRWHRARGASPMGPLPGWTTEIRNLVTGEAIITATDVQVHVPVEGFTTATLTLLTDDDGRPISPMGSPFPGEDGKPRTGEFEFIVAEMQTVLSSDVTA